ncbi:AraC family transcriptional regulator [Nocardioides perillae]|uniref:AraC-like DNA-binding protein n=1 Tax=Nocardioides perillae TaxID=1119534 RepID=A0A7Y9RTC6_9ACTN|nr:AraC family transcriptional regulator [Nocardioides perillae]NYG55975.1 AraC-like DNA-binding protein [Nocardioides perillae]
MAVIRSAGLRGFRATVAELGGDADALVREVGLPVEALDTDDLLVDDLAVATVLEVAAARLDCPDLGLRVASRQDLGMLGTLALAVQNSPTMRDALECTSRYLFLHSRSLSLSLEPDPYAVRGVVAIRYGSAPGLPDPVQGTDIGLGVLHRMVARLVGGPYGLRTVELPYHPPAPVARYEEFFGVEVRPGRPAALLRVPASLADRPVAGSDEGTRRIALAFLAGRSPEAPVDLTARVHAAVAQALGTAEVELPAVARLLAVHPRTLQRRLAGEGTTFAAVVDEVRRDTAWRYLTTTDLPLGQVAGLVGLAEQAVLTRCCRRWFGATPTAVRRAAR